MNAQKMKKPKNFSATKTQKAFWRGERKNIQKGGA